jgi:hypothetical protein
MTQRFAYAALCAAALGSLGGQAPAQTVYPPPTEQSAQAAGLTPAQLDQLVAPVALYPDTLLAQVLVASTYPLDVVQADRWISQSGNASLDGAALVQAAAAQGWDASVQALLPFPQVLQLMDNDLSWTEKLGEAFLAQPQDVMNAVQRLRHRAQDAGTLKITPDQSVVNEGDAVTIASAAGPDAYVPSYNPQCVYGPGPVDGAVLGGVGNWAGGCGTAADNGILYDPVFLPYGFFPWGDIDWRNHRIHIDRERYALANSGREPDGDVWRHDPARRRGAAYRNPMNARRFAHFAPAPGQFHYYDAFTRDHMPGVRRADFVPRPVPAGRQSMPRGMRYGTPHGAMAMRAPVAARAAMAPAAGHAMSAGHR